MFSFLDKYLPIKDGGNTFVIYKLSADSLRPKEENYLKALFTLFTVNRKEIARITRYLPWKVLLNNKY